MPVASVVDDDPVVAPAAPPRADGQIAVRRLLLWIVPAVLFGLAVVFALVQAGTDALRVEPYFDEMWRVDLVRSTGLFDHVLPGVTPIPAGWVFMLRGLQPLIGTDTEGYRIASILLYAPAVAAVFFLLRELGRPRRVTHGSTVLASVTAAAAALSLTVFPVVTNLSRYFNQYLFEVAYTAALVTCCVLIGRRTWAFVAFLVGAAAAPLFVISPLAMLPALFAAAVWWAATADAERRARRLLATGAAAVTSGVIALVVYAGFYAQLSNRGLEAFWHDELLSNADGDVLLVGRSLELLRNGVLGNLFGTGGGPWALGTIVVVGSFVVGTVTACRRWPWFGVLLVSGWLSTIAAGLVADGPVTPVRVTLGFYWVVYVAIALGFFRAIGVGRRATVGAARDAVRGGRPCADHGTGRLVADAAGRHRHRVRARSPEGPSPGRRPARRATTSCSRTTSWRACTPTTGW